MRTHSRGVSICDMGGACKTDAVVGAFVHVAGSMKEHTLDVCTMSHHVRSRIACGSLVKAYFVTVSSRYC